MFEYSLEKHHFAIKDNINYYEEKALMETGDADNFDKYIGQQLVYNSWRMFH